MRIVDSVTAPHALLNAAAQQGHERAADHLAALTRAYGRVLRAAGRRAASRFARTETLHAAAEPNQPNWAIPPTLALIDRQELQADAEKKTAKLHRLILASATSEALAPFNISYDVRAPVSQAILESYAQRIRQTITSAIAEQVTEATKEGYAKGMSVPQVSQLIRTKTAAISKMRADMLARSDLIGLANAGSLYAATTSGAASSKTWKTAGDERVRPDHEEADGQTVGINDTFTVGGEDCQFPGDSQLSWDQAANCRCVALYGTGEEITASAPRPRERAAFDAWCDNLWDGYVAPKELSEPGGLSARASSPDSLISASPSQGQLYLARHGLTAYDSDDHSSDTIRGWADDPLNDEGVEESKRLAQNLRGLGITSARTSDLIRASRMALYIAQSLDINPKLDRTLRPWNLGDLQGRTTADCHSELAGFVDHPDNPVPGGESFNDFCSRFLPAVADAMAAAEAGASPLLVTHSHNLKLARAWIAGGRQPVSGEQFMAEAPGPASVLAFDPGNGWACEEILCDGKPLEESGFVPPEAHYRPSDDPAQACAICEFMEADGSCSRFEGDPQVLPDYVCDEFVAKSTLTSGGTMSIPTHTRTGPTPPSEIVVELPSGALATWQDLEGRTHALVRDGRSHRNVTLAAGTSIPLGDRDRSWDAPAATKRVANWASSDGSGDKEKVDWGKYGRAFFAGSGTDFGDYHLPFCDIVGGKLTAIWKGIVAAGQRLNQTQGVDKAAIWKAIDGWYRKAAKQYGDDSIVAPGDKNSAAANGETLAAIRAHLEDMGADVLDDDEIRAHILVADWLAVEKQGHAYQPGGQAGMCQLCGLPMSAHHGLPPLPVALAAAAEGGTAWQAVLCVEDEPTIDSGVKRIMAPGSLTWLPLPLPLFLMDESPHVDATTKGPQCGRIDQIWKAGNIVQGAGVFFDGSSDPKLQAAGSTAAALAAEMHGRLSVSADLADADWEIMEYSDGGIVLDSANDPTASNYDAPPDPSAPGGPATETDYEDEPEEAGEPPEIIMVCQSAVIAGATIVAVGALSPTATISVVASGYLELTEEALTAAAAGLAPLEPPAAWFSEPEHGEPTPLTVTDDGQVFGHLALWGTCHTGKPGACVTPPRSPTGYAAFHRGEVKTAEGDRIPVGVLTMNTGHAGLRMSASATVAHYDDTGTQAAHVRATDGDYGIWLAGALNPKLAAEDVRVLMAAPPSGDWRNTGDGLDLFAALAVNGPGFPVPRARLVASGASEEVLALVAAGCVPPAKCEPCEESFARELAVLAASADGIEGLAALVEA